MAEKISYLPGWPAEEDATATLRLNLDKRFSFRHYSGFRQASGPVATAQPEDKEPFFLRPEAAIRQVQDFLEQAHGGSLLVSGYRGTGKSSIVHCALDKQSKEARPLLLKIELNLSTINRSLDVLMLLVSQLETIQSWPEEPGKSGESKEGSKFYWLKRLAAIRNHFAIRSTVSQRRGPGIHWNDPYATDNTPDAEHSFDQSVALGQQSLEQFLQDLKHALGVAAAVAGEEVFKIVIIYDELDKLIPAGSLVEAAGSSLSLAGKARRMEQMQKIVADLKFLFTESRCHHIFIAGKDADESWQEDQHKGEGIFESVFAYNVYVRSLFAAEFPEEAAKLEGELATIGVSPHSISANTGRLVIKMLDEDEQKRLRAAGDQHRHTEIETRALRIFIHYLTYKGRGIARKVLREFYSYVRRSTNEKNEPEMDLKKSRYHFRIRRYELQRMAFYAKIVEHFDDGFVEFRTLDDKGRVSLFHIVDYILKFYETGFTKQDIETANFMTAREELFPGHRLVSDVIDFLDGRLFQRKDRRSAEYRLLPSVVNDLTKLFLRHGPEQMELRHTVGEFEQEMTQLKSLWGSAKDKEAERRQSVIGLIRLGRIYEHLGRQMDARITYGTAMRHLRHDIESYSRQSKRTGTIDELRGVSDLTDSFLPTYVGFAVRILHRLGHLHDMVDEHRAALQFYSEAIEMHRRLCSKREDPMTNFPYELFDDSDMSLERTLGSEQSMRKDLIYTGEKPSFARGLQQLRIQGEPEGIVHSYNHAAISAEKLWARQAANGYLLSALDYCHAVNDEYGMIDQIVLISQIMIQRREMKSAALWLLRAAKYCADLYQAADTASRGQNGGAWSWATPSAQTQTVARILTGLGDVYFATHGQAFVPARRAGEAEQSGAVWATLRTALPHFIDESRPSVYCYERARLLFENCNDVAGVQRSRMRQLILYVETLDAVIRKGDQKLGQLSFNPDPEKATNEVSAYAYDMMRTWVSFWRDAKAAMLELLITKPALMRTGRRTWGNVSDRRSMGGLMRVVGEVLMNVALTGHVQTDRSMRALMSSYADSKIDPRADAESYKQHYSHLIAKGRKLPRPDRAFNLASHLDSQFLKIEIERQAKKDPAKSTIPSEVAAWTDLLAAAADICDIFAYISDTADHITERKEMAKITAEVQPQSVLWRISDVPATGSHPQLLGQRLIECLTVPGAVTKKSATEQGSAEAVDRNALEGDLTLLALAEKALLTGHLNYRESISSIGHAQNCLALGKCYARMIYLSLCDIHRDAFADADKRDAIYWDLHEHTQRFLSLCVSILEKEPVRQPFAQQIASEALFVLGDMNYAYWRLYPWTNGERGAPVIAPGISPLKNKPVGKIGETVIDVKRQIVDYYQRGLRHVLQELDEHQSRYPLAQGVYYAYRNILDMDTQFYIARAVHQRHTPATGMTEQNPDARVRDGLLQRCDQIGRAIKLANNPFLSPAEWVQALIPLLREVNSVRTDRCPLTVSDTTVGWSSLEALSVERTVYLFP